MIGRLDAPGAKLAPVMPGLSKRRSPRVAAPLRRISAPGTTVTVANWSVANRSVPCRPSLMPVAVPDWIGLDAVTEISGSTIWA
jgi:hypothetical protein